jgi:hypothetical protein
MVDAGTPAFRESSPKLKGKIGQQKVVVEHVNVNAGGRAVVGTITAVEGANAKQRG